MAGALKIIQIIGAVAQTADQVLNTIQTARPFICSAYQAQAGLFTNMRGTGLDPRNLTSVGQLSRGLMDSFCRDRPLPPPAAPPFSGGQCTCELYRYTFRVDLYRDDGSLLTSINGSDTYYGAIAGVGSEPSKSATAPPGHHDFFVWVAQGCSSISLKKRSTGTTGDPKKTFVTITGVTRVSGADTCGNLPPEDPYLLPPPAGSPIVNLPNITIPNPRGGNLIVPVGVFIPIVKTDINFNVKVEIPINMGGINFRLGGDEFYQVEPNLDVDVDFSSVNTNITNATTNINNNTNTKIDNSTNTTNTNITNARNTINSNTDTRINSATTTINNNTSSTITTATTNINNNTNTQIAGAVTNISNSVRTDISSSTNSINSSINTVRVDLSAQLNALAVLVGLIQADVRLSLEAVLRLESKPDCPEPIKPPDEIPPEPPKPPDEGGDSPTRKKLKYIEIILTKKPHKAQFGNNGAQSVYFAGWVAFRSATGSYYERQQINFGRSIFEAPQSGADGYTYTLTHGARGQVVEYYE